MAAICGLAALVVIVFCGILAVSAVAGALYGTFESICEVYKENKQA